MPKVIDYRSGKDLITFGLRSQDSLKLISRWLENPVINSHPQVAQRRNQSGLEHSLSLNMVKAFKLL